MIKFKAKVLLAINEMTQKELAEKTGIRPPTVSAICTGAVKHFIMKRFQSTYQLKR